MKIKTGGTGKATPHAEYIVRQGEYANRLQREKLEYTEHGNMPKWAEHNPIEFWKAADLYERKNGSTYREFEISLPRELSKEQRIKLVQFWVKQEIGDKHPYSLAIHNPTALDGGEQPHAHIMFNERKLDGIERDPDQYFKRFNNKNPERGGAQKLNTGKDYTTRREEIKATRERWESVCNTHLESAGVKARISLKSLKDQGIDRIPERKYLPSEVRNPEKVAELIEFRAARENAQNRSISMKDVEEGVGSVFDRFIEYKREKERINELAMEINQRLNRQRQREELLQQELQNRLEREQKELDRQLALEKENKSKQELIIAKRNQKEALIARESYLSTYHPQPNYEREEDKPKPNRDLDIDL